MNNVSLSGNVCKDIQIRSTQAGKQVASFSIAINEGKDKTEFVNCVAWEKTADLLSQYVKKGDRLACVGRLQTRKWDDQSGTTRYATEVVVTSFDFPPKRADAQDKEDVRETVHEDMDDSEIPF